MKTILVLGVVALIAVFIIAQYNRLIRLNITVDEAWAQIEVQLKRRADLIPNLVETVKGYAKHEQSTFDAVVEARAKSTSASTIENADKVVFTNGCFDILHKGHVTYLAKSAELGDRLIVALNTDASVREQGKGENRPINPEDARATVLAALGFVDMVVFFNDQTPLQVIEMLQPDVLVKGADYDPNETDTTSKKYIVGSDIVKKNGGEVVAIQLVDGYSTTSIIEKSKA